MILICLDIFRDDERLLHPPRRVRLSKKNASIGPENKKPTKQLFALKFENSNAKLRNILYYAGPSFLLKLERLIESVTQ